jgi:hypothetical protein
LGARSLIADKMSNTTIYSREFLRGAPDAKRREEERCRREQVDYAVTQISKLILKDAEMGKTEWELNLGQLRNGSMRGPFGHLSQELRPLRTSEFDDEEIVEGFRRKFPDCDVTISQDWVDVRPGARELQTRVTVSWK